jgi:hypothetical protein
MKVVDARRVRFLHPNIRPAVKTQRERGLCFCQVADDSQRSGGARTAVATGRRSGEAFVGDPSRTIAGAGVARRPDALPVAQVRTGRRRILTLPYLSNKFDLGNLLRQHPIDVGSLIRSSDSF